MNKTLSILAAIFTVAAASAVTVTWACDDLYSDKTKTSWLDEGCVAYLFEGGADDLAATIDAIKGGTFDSSTAIATTGTDDSGSVYKTKIGDYKSETVSLYMVVFNKDTVSDTANFMGVGPVSQTFGSSGNKTFNFTASVNNDNWAPVKAQDIPEPTSIALIALGLAAVGLKRKVA